MIKKSKASRGTPMRSSALQSSPQGSATTLPFG